MTITTEHQSSMLEAAKPLMDWMNKNVHPHCIIHVDFCSAELTEDIARVILG